MHPELTTVRLRCSSAAKAVGEKYGVKPLARILAGAAVGVEPRVMGVGPAYAIPKALETRAGLKLSDLDIHRDQRSIRFPGAGLPEDHEYRARRRSA